MWSQPTDLWKAANCMLMVSWSHKQTRLHAGSLVDWQDTFALVLGNEASGDGLWQGTLRLVAIHDRELSQEQVTQNYDVGVGEKFFLLFSIEDIINVPTAYILFEVAQYDNYSYLFTRPHFLTLDPAQQPEGIPIQGCASASTVPRSTGARATATWMTL